MRSQMMKPVVSMLILTFALSSCCHCQKSIPDNPPTPSPKAPIPNPSPCPGFKINQVIMGYTSGTVRLFRYNSEGKSGASLFEDGLNLASLEALPDAPSLDYESGKVFRDALCYEKGASVKAPCYIPRHVAVFYNMKNEVIGFLEICFECNRARFVSEGASIEDVALDFEILADLFEKLEEAVVFVDPGQQGGS